MQLEDYFDFLAPNDIRVKGTRVGIETILWDYLDLGLFPEQIAARYRTLSLEQVYATPTTPVLGLSASCLHSTSVKE